MVSSEAFRQLALSFEKARETPHFEKASFRVNKKIFATLNLVGKKAVLKLSPLDQSTFCAFDAAVMYPVPGAWGKHGWTMVDLTKVRKPMLKDALTCAFCNRAPKSLAGKYATNL